MLGVAVALTFRIDTAAHHRHGNDCLVGRTIGR